MGTRSTIKFIEKYGDVERPLVNIYQQFDGYIDGVGHELAEWLMKKTIVNGIEEFGNKTDANGAGCLAAQFIRDFKVDIGGLYITTMDNEQSYNYKVVVDGVGKADDCIKIVVFHGEKIFEGTPSELAVF